MKLTNARETTGRLRLSRTGSTRRAGLWYALGLGLVVLLGLSYPGFGQLELPPETARQVTLFGILATPQDDSLDPKLQPIGPQLRRLFPNHGFKLMGVNTQRIGPGQSVPVPLGAGYMAQAQLVNPLDMHGKAQLRLELDHNGLLEFATLVNTPLNQLFFVDKRFPDGSRLVLGIGVRP